MIISQIQNIQTRISDPIISPAVKFKLVKRHLTLVRDLKRVQAAEAAAKKKSKKKSDVPAPT